MMTARSIFPLAVGFALGAIVDVAAPRPPAPPGCSSAPHEAAAARTSGHDASRATAAAARACAGGAGNPSPRASSPDRRTARSG